MKFMKKHWISTYLLKELHTKHPIPEEVQADSRKNSCSRKNHLKFGRERIKTWALLDLEVSVVSFKIVEEDGDGSQKTL